MKSTNLALLLLATLALACSAPERMRATKPEPKASASSASAASPSAPIAFIEDDYPRALAEAKASNKPLFIDAWAAWCHSCLSLKSYVLDAPEMRARRDKFVWLSLDSEKAQNTAILSELGLDVLPTLWIIDAQKSEPVWKLPGTLTAKELAVTLDRFAPGAAKSAIASDTLLAQAERATARKDPKEAARLLASALEQAPVGWSRRPEAVLAYVSALSEAKDTRACTDAATREGPSLPMGGARANVAVLGAYCTHDEPLGSPARTQLGALKQELYAVVRAKDAPLLADDRSGVFEELAYVLKDTGDQTAVKPLATEWAAFLEREAARAPNPKARVVFDAHRVLAYLELGEPARAVPMLTQSERDFPTDYNPPARLAKVHHEMHHEDEALAAVGRAIPLAEGPRRLRLYLLKADILATKGDRAGEASLLDEALAFAAQVPLREGYEKLRAQMAERRAKLGTPGKR
jgi:thioredoxin-like negative regulator of GroEL